MRILVFVPDNAGLPFQGQLIGCLKLGEREGAQIIPVGSPGQCSWDDLGAYLENHAYDFDILVLGLKGYGADAAAKRSANAGLAETIRQLYPVKPPIFAFVDGASSSTSYELLSRGVGCVIDCNDDQRTLWTAINRAREMANGFRSIADKPATKGRNHVKTNDARREIVQRSIITEVIDDMEFRIEPSGSYARLKTENGDIFLSNGQFRFFKSLSENKGVRRVAETLYKQVLSPPPHMLAEYKLHLEKIVETLNTKLGSMAGYVPVHLLDNGKYIVMAPYGQEISTDAQNKSVAAARQELR